MAEGGGKVGSGRAREGRRWSPEVMLSSAGSLDLSEDFGWRHWWWSELEGGVENEKFGITQSQWFRWNAIASKLFTIMLS